MKILIGVLAACVLTGCAGSDLDPIYTEMDNKSVTQPPEEIMDNYDFSED